MIRLVRLSVLLSLVACFAACSNSNQTAADSGTAVFDAGTVIDAGSKIDTGKDTSKADSAKTEIGRAHV